MLLNSGILGFGIRNSAQGIQNPLNDWIRNPVVGIRSPELGIQDLHGTRRMLVRKLNCLLILTTFQYYTAFLNVHWKLV